MCSCCHLENSADNGSSKYTWVKATLLVIGTIALCGGLEALLILTLRVYSPITAFTFMVLMLDRSPITKV